MSSSAPGPRPELAAVLDLKPHPEGGWYRRTWETGVCVRPDGYPGERLTATGIYYLLAPGEQSRWHRVRSDEVWLWHRGGPLTVSLGGTGDRPDAEPRTMTLGADVAEGEQPQVVVPAGTWQAAHLVRDEAVLVSCVVSPGFDFADFELLDGSPASEQ